MKKRLQVMNIVLIGLISFALFGFTPQSGTSALPRVRVGDHKTYPKASTLERAIFQEGMDAVIKGRYDEAESCLKEYILRTGDDPFQHRWLAILYDKQGKNRDAYLEWKKVMNVDPSKGRSSDQSATQILVHYGDLCGMFGDPVDESWAYKRAIEYVPQRGQDVPPCTKVSDDSLVTLKAVAHYDRALAEEGVEPPEALKDMKLASKLNPRWVYPHLWIARHVIADDRSLSKHEYALAEQLADGELKPTIHGERINHRFLAQEMVTSVEIGLDGKAIVKKVRVKPDPKK